jgi:uncharacterized protein (TIGR03118 family)
VGTVLALCAPLVTAGATGAAAAAPPPATSVLQTNLVSDIPGTALVTDSKLVNPWGISSSPAGSPFWLSDGGTGLSTLYNTVGTPSAIVVTVPGPPGSTGPATPTGNIFNGTQDFAVSKGAVRAVATFIFVTEEGTVSGWAAGVDARNAILELDNSKNAVYKGLAMANNGTGNFLYLANFRSGTIDVLDKTYAMQPASAFPFADPNMPAGYAPFNIRTIDGNLYVAYAQQDPAKKADIGGAGHGFVDVFTPNGALVKRLVSQGALNSPWGLAMAPAGFGAFSGDLLVGNFGDGHINAFDPANGSQVGTLTDSGGKPVAIEGLWGIWFGNGGNGGLSNTLYFAAGIDGQAHGLFGALTPAGYWLVAKDGGVFAYGAAPFFGSMGGKPLNSPIVTMAPNTDTKGYWMAAGDGGVFAFGTAGFFGSMGGTPLTKPIVAMAPAPDGKGYWLAASDGGVFAFGSAKFFGSMGGQRLVKPIVGMAAAQDGKGYWLVADDGGVFAFGSAVFQGSLATGVVDHQVVGITAAPFNTGYWLTTSDGVVQPFGGAPPLGTLPAGTKLSQPAISVAAAPTGHGVWVGAADGGVFAYGAVPFLGSTGGQTLNQPVVGIAALP